MVVEPVGTTLAVIGLLQPAFEGCRALYKGFRLTQSFGKDYDIARREYDFQVARLEAISHRRIDFLKQQLEPWDENDPITSQTISKLVVMKSHFETCSRLFKKYHEKEAQAEAEESGTPGDETPIEGPASLESSPLSLFQTPSPNVEPQAGALPTPPADSSREKKKRSSPLFNWKLPDIKLKKKKKQGSKAGTATPSTSGESSGVLSTGRESSEQRRDSTATTTEATSFPDILDTQAVAAAGEERAAYSNALQHSNNFFRRVVWAADDKALLLLRIKEIRDCNTDLEDILKYREPRDASQILDLDSSGSPAIQNVRRIQGALKRLHEALISVNRNASKAVRISIKLVADCDETKQDLSQEDNLTFRDGSYVFVLQVHRTNTEGAVEILVETLATQNSSGKGVATDEEAKLESLLDALANIEIGTNDNPFDFLGSVARSGSLWDRHRLFYDTENQWYSKLSLDDVIETEDFRTKLNPIQRAQLATLFSITHLYFAEVRPTCGQPQLSQFIFYTTESEAPEWNEFEPFVLNPYLSFGFGNRKQKVNPGTRSGVAKWKKSNAIVELGLLLYQISSSSKLDYGEGEEGRRRAKEQALRTIHAVDRGSGGKFAEVVEMCLNWKSPAFMEMGDEECDVVKRVVEWLMRFERKLDD
ncbi:hypothetical protein ACEPPN_017908 [Leptodophora sp. 'Broadleaf-Isolate-01']